MATRISAILVLIASVFFAEGIDGKTAKHVFMTMTGSVVAKKPTAGFFVEGIASGTGIRPTRGVEGGKDADLCTTPSPQNMLELESGHIFQPQEGRLPLPPYVHGCMTAKGVFVPANHEVVSFVGLPQ